MFLKIERGWIKIYVQNFFLHFEYYGFLTLFRIIVALITYVMQVFEFRFTVSFVSFFSFYVYWRYYMWYDTCILFYYSII